MSPCIYVVARLSFGANDAGFYDPHLQLAVVPPSTEAPDDCQANAAEHDDRCNVILGHPVRIGGLSHDRGATTHVQHQAGDLHPLVPLGSGLYGDDLLAPL